MGEVVGGIGKESYIGTLGVWSCYEFWRDFVIWFAFFCICTTFVSSWHCLYDFSFLPSDTPLPCLWDLWVWDWRHWCVQCQLYFYCSLLLSCGLEKDGIIRFML